MALAVYALTLSPTVWWLDSGIYLSAAHNLGIAYPPGYPVYLTLAHLVGSLPIPVTFAHKVHFVSALFAASAALLAAWTARSLGWGRWAQLTVGLAVAFGYSLWSQAINAEVYAMQAFVTLLLLFAVVRRNAWLLAVALGLGFSNHPMSIALLPLAAWSWWHLPGRPVRPFLVGGAIALVPYLYLPLRAHSGPLIHGNWGLMDGWGMLLPFVTGATWTSDQSNFALFTPDFWRNLWNWLQMSWLQWGFLGMLAALAGLWLLRRDVRLWLLFWPAGLLACVYQTGEMPSWLIPSHLVLALAMGAAVEKLPAHTRWSALLIPVLALGNHWQTLDRHAAYFAEDYARTILHGLEPKAILLLSGDNPLSTVMYLQEVLGERRDVTVIQIDAYREDWYRRHIGRQGLANPVEPPIETWAKTRPLYGLVPSHIAIPKHWYFSPAGAVFRITRTPAERPDPKLWTFPLRQDPLNMTADPELGGKHIDCRKEVWQLQSRSLGLLAGWYAFLGDSATAEAWNAKKARFDPSIKN